MHTAAFAIVCLLFLTSTLVGCKAPQENSSNSSVQADQTSSVGGNAMARIKEAFVACDNLAQSTNDAAVRIACERIKAIIPATGASSGEVKRASAFAFEIAYSVRAADAVGKLQSIATDLSIASNTVDSDNQLVTDEPTATAPATPPAVGSVGSAVQSGASTEGPQLYSCELTCIYEQKTVRHPITLYISDTSDAEVARAVKPNDESYRMHCKQETRYGKYANGGVETSSCRFKGGKPSLYADGFQ